MVKLRGNRVLNVAVGVALVVGTVAASGQQLQQRPRYLIHEGDQITVHFPLTPEFDQLVAVQPDGYVVMNVGGNAKLAGLDQDQATALIREHAMVRLKDPEVHLVMTDFQHPYFVVAGEVNNPNRYDLRENITALQAVMFAGGSKVTGKDSQVIYIHLAASGNPLVRVLNMKHKNARTAAETPILQSGDIVFVPRTHITDLAQWTNIISPIVGYATPVTAIATTAHY